MPPEPDDPEQTTEQDACGIGFVADLSAPAGGSSAERGHRILQLGLEALARLDHRGARDADHKTSDGCGILTHVPTKFLCRELSLDRDDLGVGVFFLPPKEDPSFGSARELILEVLEESDLALGAFRHVPVDLDVLGRRARATRPEIVQVIVAAPAPLSDEDFERHLYLVRRRIERRIAKEKIPDVVAVSFSCRTVVYKSMAPAADLASFYPDLRDPDFETPIVLFHQRFSTNTRPSWRLAQPFRMLAHNGEINTIQGNANWMESRQSELKSHVWGERLRELLPVLDRTGSDSAMLDNMLEFLVRSGRDPLHVLGMLLPEASRRGLSEKDPELRAFFDYHSALIEPWDGPAGLVACDGRTAAAALDRNGLRPMRFWRTHDDVVVVGSETGLMDVAEGEIAQRGRLGPGQVLAVDLVRGGLATDAEIKHALARRRPYRRWMEQQVVAPPPEAAASTAGGTLAEAELLRLQIAFGYSSETLERIFHPMMEGKLPVASMGNDTPLAVLSHQPQLLYGYFKQRFAQVTNPPIDPIRERLVFDLESLIGGCANLLDEKPSAGHMLRFPSPVLTAAQFAWLCELQEPAFRSHTLPALFPASDPGALRGALQRLCREALKAVNAGARLLILSDRGVDARNAPIPMLLATAAVHHHLVRRQRRMRMSIVCDTGEPREDHHFACLIGYGATLVHPYLADETILREAERSGKDTSTAQRKYRAALEQGLLKALSRLGVCPISSYHGAQLFEILGLDLQLVKRYFGGTRSRVSGVDERVIAQDMIAFHQRAFVDEGEEAAKLQDRGLFRFRKGGEEHDFSPSVFKALHKAVREESTEAFDTYTDLVDHHAPSRLRDLLSWRPSKKPLELQEVEPAADIARRFCGAAMSHGALSREVHEALAVAMNRLGARSNSGEGGEAPERYLPYGEGNEPPEFPGGWRPIPGDLGNSTIKQVASGRFGVTPRYLRSAREIEIKMAQGSKPGEGGQIPGFKVTEEIARQRHSTPGVTLISPPPHHDIYSIEDLAQLIHDLKRVHPGARVGVKLVSETGVGTVASGVVKAYADYVMIAGEDGGTGASPLSSIKHAGMPWELGLADAQRSLVRAGLRKRVTLRVDGGLKTGRDVILAALLGAEEYGFGTAPLVALGCVMARRCHLNTCPVGVATQDEKLRGRFPGRPEQAVAFMLFVAEQVRHILAHMGFTRLEDIVGRFDLLIPREDRAPMRGIDLRRRLLVSPTPRGARETRPQDDPTQFRGSGERNDPPPEAAGLDERLYQDVLPRLQGEASPGEASPGEASSGETPEPLVLSYEITNRDRSVGARLSGEVAERFGEAGLRPGSVVVDLRGTAGQSFGAFLCGGVELRLVGDAQDYVGKGLAGGRLALRLPAGERPSGSDSVIAGNVLLYGATGGELFAAGRVGERFAVRNSGASAVVEGCGDHGCEYMTSGTAVILGELGRNFGAGMTGGEAFVAAPMELVRKRFAAEWVTICDELGDDLTTLFELLTRHVELTGSRRGGAILDAWPQTAVSFVRIVPRVSAPERARPADADRPMAAALP